MKMGYLNHLKIRFSEYDPNLNRSKASAFRCATIGMIHPCGDLRKLTHPNDPNRRRIRCAGWPTDELLPYSRGGSISDEVQIRKCSFYAT